MEELKTVDLNDEIEADTINVSEKSNVKKTLLKFALGAIFSAGTSIIVGSVVNKVCPTKGKNVAVKGVVIVTTLALSDLVADAITDNVINNIHEIGEAIKGIGASISDATSDKKVGQNG